MTLLALPGPVAAEVLAWLPVADVRSFALLSRAALAESSLATHVFVPAVGRGRPAAQLWAWFPDALSVEVTDASTLARHDVAELLCAFPRLQQLALSAVQLPEASLAVLRGERLRRLQLRGTFSWRREVQYLCKLASLTHLDLEGWRRASDADLAQLCGGLTALTELRLANVPALRQPVLDSGSLTHVSLRRCRALEALELRCPLLSSLELAACGVTADSLSDVVSRCPRLRQVTLSECQELRALSLESPSVEILSLQVCNGLTGLALALPELKRFDFHCSTPDMGSVAVASQRLESLTLFDCGLRWLEVACPVLSELKLDLCRQLEGGHVDCPQLRVASLAWCPLPPEALPAQCEQKRMQASPQ